MLRNLAISIGPYRSIIESLSWQVSKEFCFSKLSCCTEHIIRRYIACEFQFHRVKIKDIGRNEAYDHLLCLEKTKAKWLCNNVHYRPMTYGSLIRTVFVYSRWKNDKFDICFGLTDWTGWIDTAIIGQVELSSASLSKPFSNIASWSSLLQCFFVECGLQTIPSFYQFHIIRPS